MHDPVNNPSHYSLPDVKSVSGELFNTDVLSVLEALSKKIDSRLTGYEVHAMFSALAYIMRSPFKDSLVQDIDKSIFYLNELKKEYTNG